MKLSDSPLKSARSVKKLYNVSPMSPRVDLCELMDTLYEDAIEMSESSNYRAYFWKSADNLCNVFILIASAIITALGSAASTVSARASNTTFNAPEDASFSYAIIAISGALFVVKGMTMYFLFRKRAINEKNNSVKLKKIARTVKILKNTPRLSNQEILKQLDLLYAEIDQIELNTFNTEIGDNVGMAANVVKTSSAGVQPNTTVSPSAVVNDTVEKMTDVIADQVAADRAKMTSILVSTI